MKNKIIIDKPKTLFKKISQFIYWRIWYKIKNAYYNIRHRLFYKHHLVITTLPKGTWIDTDERLLYANMELLMQFIEYEKPFETTDWDWTFEHRKAKKTIQEIVKWWKNRPNRLKEIENLTSKWYRTPKKDRENNKILFNKIDILEKKLDKEETEMLKKIIEIRHYLWT